MLTWTRLLLGIAILQATASVVAAQQDVSHIQVKADPGIQIFLGGTFKGTTTADVGGLVIQGITPGTHTLRAVKTGFHPQEARLNVARGQVLVYTLKPFVPKIQISEQGDQKTGQLALRVGTLVVQSLPVECLIDSPAMGFKGVQKSKDVWVASEIPEGLYEITFRALGKTLRHRVSIRTNETEKLLVNFLDGRVVDLAAPEREQRQKEEEARRAKAEEERQRTGSYRPMWCPEPNEWTGESCATPRPR